MVTTDEYETYMKQAYAQALLAYEQKEVPIGCVIVYENEIIARAFNQRNGKKNVLYHAEITAIDQACAIVGDWRLEGCSIFVTVEPCPMCAGAIVQARMDELVFGTRNKKAGCCGSILNIPSEPALNHQVKITEGVWQAQSSELMSRFFKEFRS